MNVSSFYSSPSGLLQCFLFQLMASVAQNRNLNVILFRPPHWGCHKIRSIFLPTYISNLPILFTPTPYKIIIYVTVVLNLKCSNNFHTGHSASVLGILLSILHFAMNAVIFFLMQTWSDHSFSLLKILLMSSHYPAAWRLI